MRHDDQEHLIDQLIMSDGATLALDTLTAPAAGVCVGRPGEGIILDRPDRASVRAWLDDVSATVPAVGIWRDSESGLYYLDAVDLLDSVLDALDLAAARHELAVFDLSTMSEYTLAA